MKKYLERKMMSKRRVEEGKEDRNGKERKKLERIIKSNRRKEKREQ